MTAYYNEHDPFAAAWLRELIAEGHIASGEVDERDIQDVTPNDLRPFRQVHLFAGIGIWSAALRGAGWSDDREAWTVSCPCQPFSAAGQRKGFADERHLWPAAYHLIDQRRPVVVLGEQSASKDGLTWFDLVSADMEAADYSGGPTNLCSAGFGAPNLRQRNYFVWLANAMLAGRAERRAKPGHRSLAGSSGVIRLAHASCEGPSELVGRREQPARLAKAGRSCRMGNPSSAGAGRDAGAAFGEEAEGGGPRHSDGGHGGHAPVASSPACGMADANGGDTSAEGLQRGREHGQRAQDGGACQLDHGGRPGAANGFWRAADWLFCTDGIWRPVMPGTFPLVTGRVPKRVAKLRGSGNALNREVAQGFVEAVDAYLVAQSERRAA